MFVVSSLIFIILFYGICLFGLLCDGGKEKIKNLIKSFSKKNVMFILLLFILFVAFIAYWAKQNKFIYYWDYSGYWTMSIDRTNFMKSNSFIEIIKTFFSSVNNDDYNIFLPSVIALPFSLIGKTFARYVFLVSMMFLAPTILVQGMITAKFVEFENKNLSKYYIAGLIIAMLMPGNYYAVFRGYIDIAYLLPMSISIYLFIDYDFKRISITRNIAISLLLILSWISRRYAIFFIIGFVVAMIVKAVFVLISDKETKSNKKSLINISNIKPILINFAMIGALSLGILLVFFRQFFLHALLTNYGEMYSAYDSPIATKLIHLKAAFGIISTLIILLVGILCFVHKKNRRNYVCLILFILSSTLTFWMTQSMGTQHRMILNVPIYTIFVMSLGLVDFSLRNRKLERVTCVAVTVCGLAMTVNFSKAFVTKLSVNGTTDFFSERYYPLVRNDIDQVKKLVNRLNELTEGTDDWIYAAASGSVLNCDILRKVNMPDSSCAINNLYDTSDVDLRDGFPKNFFPAKYIVTTSPVQLHLDSGQEVVSYIAEGVQDEKSCIGCHYKEMEEIKLENNVVAKIYVKTSEYTSEDLQQIRDYFMNIYPDYKELFEDRIHL